MTPARKAAATGLARAQAAAASDGEPAATDLQASQRGEAEGDPEGEGELAVGEQGDDAGREPEGRPARLHPPAVADQAVEEVGGGDDGEHADHLRSEQRPQRREEEAVGEGVVAAVPAAVPDREAGALEELGAEDLGREVADGRVPDEHQHRERGAERHGREPFGSENLGLDHQRAIKDRAASCNDFKMSDEILVVHCGTVPYEEAREAQQRLEGARQEGEIADVLLLLEHPPVYTRGRRSTPEELPMGAAVVRDAGDRSPRHRPRRPRHLPRPRPAGRLPDRQPRALRRRRPRVRAPAGAGDDRGARRARRPGADDRGPDRRLDRGRPPPGQLGRRAEIAVGAETAHRPRGAEDRVDRGARQPRGHHPRAGGQRQQRPAAVRVDRALRDRGRADDLARARAGRRAGASTPSRDRSPSASARSSSARRSPPSRPTSAWTCRPLGSSLTP